MTTNKSFIEGLDVAKGWKMISGLTIVVISLFASKQGDPVDIDALGVSLDELGLLVGSFITTFGGLMKIIRK